MQPKTGAADLLQQRVTTHVTKRQPALALLHVFTDRTPGIQREWQKQGLTFEHFQDFLIPKTTLFQ